MRGTQFAQLRAFVAVAGQRSFRSGVASGLANSGTNISDGTVNVFSGGCSAGTAGPAR